MILWENTARAFTYNSYHGHIDDIDLRLYEDCRHELCNELNKEEIYEEIYGWIMNHMSK